MIEAHHEPTCLVGGDHHAHSHFAWDPFKKDHTFTVDNFANCIARKLGNDHMKKFCEFGKENIGKCIKSNTDELKNQNSEWVNRAFVKCRDEYGVNPSSQSNSGTSSGAQSTISSKKSFSASSLTSLVVINKRYTRYQLMSFI